MLLELPPGAACGSLVPGGPQCASSPCENLPLLTRVPVMDIEHINQIGNNLADLAARTDALRGYL